MSRKKVRSTFMRFSRVSSAGYQAQLASETDPIRLLHRLKFSAQLTQLLPQPFDFRIERVRPSRTLLDRVLQIAVFLVLALNLGAATRDLVLKTLNPSETLGGFRLELGNCSSGHLQFGIQTAGPGVALMKFREQTVVRFLKFGAG